MSDKSKAIGGIGVSGWDVKQRLIERELARIEKDLWGGKGVIIGGAVDWHGEASKTLGEEDA
jgi:hypothetical protein